MGWEKSQWYLEKDDMARDLVFPKNVQIKLLIEDFVTQSPS